PAHHRLPPRRPSHPQNLDHFHSRHQVRVNPKDRGALSPQMVNEIGCSRKCCVEHLNVESLPPQVRTNVKNPQRHVGLANLQLLLVLRHEIAMCEEQVNHSPLRMLHFLSAATRTVYPPLPGIHALSGSPAIPSHLRSGRSAPALPHFSTIPDAPPRSHYPSNSPLPDATRLAPLDIAGL